MNRITQGLVALCLAATATAQTPAGSRTGAQRIGADDTVVIQALSADELSKSWRVNSTGELTLPMVGRVSAAGMTVSEFEAEIAQRLKKFVKNPQVSAYVAEPRSRPVSVTGAVQQPGLYQLDGPATLFDVIARAGGPKDPNGTVSLVRDRRLGEIPMPGARLTEGGQFSVVDLELKQATDAHSRASNLALQPFDRVTVVPPKQQQLVYISGEVTRPGAVELVSQDVVSLMKLLAVGGGLTRTSAPSKTIVAHVNTAGVQTSMARIDLKKIMQGKAKDLELMPGDIVYVPSSGWSAFMQSAGVNAVTAGLYILARY